MEVKINFNYTAGSVKYYLLTGNSGYASAHFRYPCRINGVNGLVVPVTRPGSGLGRLN
ncbi:hypothetical protein [Desulfotomaculum copahuensis]|uniref:hypothetical protein n=1 Tax=Desulfotomaculum copahuensis TaxID=1838280 RepID=UPI000ADA23D0|nr:hypothetical protein [Desulfotomaculum copahuensis]